MLLDNASEVTEPYKYEYVNSLTKEKETITRADDINIGGTLSMHLYGYIKQQFNHEEDDELVAEDEPPESGSTDHGNLTDSSAAAPIGKSKKDKEKALMKGELLDHLWFQ